MELRIVTKYELVEIIRKHAMWLADESDGKRADLSDADLSNADLRNANLSNADLSDANLILIGQDIRGYLFWAFQDDDGVAVIRAGCRMFTGIAAAYAHWTERHTSDEILHADCLSMVARCEAMAKARGWKLETE